ncbi:MAG: MBL fold metallo-hydrolase [Vulcanimicrobiaceae bacterium]
MYFKQFYLGCLAHASYLIGSQGAGAVVDPQRDVDHYLAEARDAGLTIRYVIETHLHADFVSGHRELAERTGAEILISGRAGATFAHRALRDGDEIELGTLRLQVLETPGHTPEGICLLAADRAQPGAAPKLFSGDTLFVGDVGRPDLAGSKGFTSREMAAMLYDSLHEKLLRLPDRVEVYPAHGAGSLCGRNISQDTMSTLGVQRLTNYALQPMSKEAFIAMMTDALPETPAYFAFDVEANRSGAPPLEALERPAAMSPAELRRAQGSGTLVLDVRPYESYGPHHVPRSLNVGLDGQFASWAGTLVPFERPLAIVAEDEAAVDQAVMRLARVGCSNASGYLAGGIAAWERAGLGLAATAQIDVDELAARLARRTPMQLLDVRRPREFESGSAPGARSLPLASLEAHLDELDPSAPTVVVCGSGYRSSIATSLLESAGFSDLTNVEGGIAAYVQRGHPLQTPAPAGATGADRTSEAIAP